MNYIKAVIVDDEKLSREYIKTLLKDYDNFEVVEESANGLEALEAIEEFRPDIVFLDIQMPDLNGFQVMKELNGNCKSSFIFTTAHDKYALEAFEVSAIDYLLKPFSKERFDKAIQKAISLSTGLQQTEFNYAIDKLLNVYSNLKGLPQQNNYLKKVLVRENKKIFLVPLKDVYHLEASGDYVKIHLKNRTHLVNNSLNNLEPQLDPGQFTRIHRSAIINSEYIKEFTPHFNGEFIITLDNDIQVKMSRTYKHQFKEFIGR